MRVLGHLAALISVKEDIVDVKGSSNKRLLVSGGYRYSSGSSSKGAYSPQALTDGAEINVNLDLVVLKGNKRKSKTRVAVEPEKKRDVKGGLRKSLARSTYLRRTSSRSTGSRDISERRIGDVG